jgi:homoserine O-acetyltransferase/O-succinyltransferase
MFYTYQHPYPFLLESGVTLPGYHLGYTIMGQLNVAKNNVVWVFHALTANSNPAEWWDGLVGTGKFFNPEAYCIICVNMPGSCYGSISPLHTNPHTGEPYYHQFPFFTPRDMIRAYQHLKAHLGITKIHVGIGGSMGGQQLLEWAIEEPTLFEHIVPIATGAALSPWAIAFNASQRFCIESDPTWLHKNDTAGIAGMKVARSIALLSYRNYHTYCRLQAEDDVDKFDDFKVESYQRYQGKKLADRFNAFSYYAITKSMDSHNVGRYRGGIATALGTIKAATLVIGITSDILFPLSEQQLLAKSIGGASLITIESTYGHDGFLLEFTQIEHALHKFITGDKY